MRIVWTGRVAGAIESAKRFRRPARGGTQCRVEVANQETEVNPQLKHELTVV